MAFPRDFIFGAGTSAYQVEGSPEADGRAPSWWDSFAKTSGLIEDGSDGDRACEHYLLYKEDIALMSWLGLDAYRFSVAWPRVLPRGRGRVNQKGLDFYERLVDGLLEAGIKPYVTLYHWDLPQALADKGGWLSRDTAKSFQEFADAVSRRLGGRVASWATLNEPRCAAMVGYFEGRHAPGIQDRAKALTAAHTMLLAHGMALPVLRGNIPGAELGIVLDLKPYYPADESDSSIQAARDADGVFNRWFLDPIFRGSYPEDVMAGFGSLAPKVEDGEMELISQAIDALGVNYYTRGVVRRKEGATYPAAQEVKPEGAPRTSMDWEIFPQGLRDIIMRVHADYRPARIYVAENGAAMEDSLIDGRIDDQGRRDYLESHIRAVEECLEAGAPVKAYVVWSLMDNFEWGRGYTKRFGIVYVDYPSQRRIPKASALWYRDFIRASR